MTEREKVGLVTDGGHDIKGKEVSCSRVPRVLSQSDYSSGPAEEDHQGLSIRPDQEQRPMYHQAD